MGTCERLLPVADRGDRAEPHGGIAAHTPNEAGVWHLLTDHLVSVAEMARKFAEPLGFGEVAYYVGLWHDGGKAGRQFRAYLAACAAGDPKAKNRFPQRDHKRAGLLLAKESGCMAAAFAIDGHHGGIPALATLRERFANPEELADVISTVEAILRPRPLRPNRALALPKLSRRDEEMRVRFLASCLVDADFLDTERHFMSSRPEERTTVPLSELQAPFGQHITELHARSEQTPINAMRARYFDHVVKKARSSKPGLYRMSGPTGVGKTLAGLGAAMAHAAAHDQRRVVVALPYMTVTEQTADVYRRALGIKKAVLEHHSDVSERSDTLWRRLAAENWDAPVVVTTVVQLFESMFSNTPAKLRKLHNLASSVILLDEAQTIPTTVLKPVVEALNWLVRYAGTTVVLMTATQPAFDLIGPFQGTDLPDWGGIDVGPAFNRVRWRVDKEPMDAGVLAAQLADAASCLCITNTVDDATKISKALEPFDPTHLYLSTRLCREHRRAVLDEVRTRLTAGLTCRLVSTQLVEAGVDLDFPRVLRVSGPLPSLVQAAGRCNRNGHLAFGDMCIVTLSEGRLPPGPYRTATDYTNVVMELFADEFDPQGERELRKWFDLFYNATTLDAHGVTDARESLDFPLVAERFRLIDRRLTVVVSWGAEDQRKSVLDVTDKLANDRRLLRSDWHLLAGFTVELLPSVFRQAKQAGLVEVLDETGLALWLGTYDSKLGVVFEQQAGEAFQW